GDLRRAVRGERTGGTGRALGGRTSTNRTTDPAASSLQQDPQPAASRGASPGGRTESSRTAIASVGSARSTFEPPIMRPVQIYSHLFVSGAAVETDAAALRDGEGV